MTHLDSMIRRHAAGEALTAEEVGLLLCLAETSVDIHERSGSDTGHLFFTLDRCIESLTAPAPAPQTDMVSDCCHAPTELSRYEAGFDDACTKCGGLCELVPAPQPEQKVCGWTWANGAWVSGCRAWAMLVSPLNNGQTVCRYCGQPIREVGPNNQPKGEQ